MKHPIHKTLLLSALFCAPSLQAQTSPDAGRLMQQMEQNKTPSIPRVAPQEPASPTTIVPKKEGRKIVVKQFRFVGSTLVDHAILAAALQDSLNQALDFDQLQDAAARVADKFREAGWIVRTFLPVQDITEGTVTIQIVEAVLSSLQVQNTGPTRVPVSRVQEVILAQQPMNQRLSAAALDRGLLLADDLPGVVVAGALREGGQQAASELAIKSMDEPMVEGEVSLSNHGARATGPIQLQAAVQINAPLGLTDQWSISALRSEGSRYIRLGEMMSVGNDGWKVGGYASHMGYDLISPEFKPLRAHGTADTWGLETSYPIIRSRSSNLYLLGQLEHKYFWNASQGSAVSNYASLSGNVGLSGNFFDGLLGGAQNQVSVFWTRGRLDLKGSPNERSDASSVNAQGQYDKWRLAYSRIQNVTSNVSLVASYNLQLASKNLDSSEKFYLGGTSGLWAYPNGEGAGSEGQKLSLELRTKVYERVQLFGFHDVGTVRVNRDNHFSGAPAKNELTYRGIGLGAHWQSKEGFAVKALWSRRLGNNPDRQSSGNDRDGTLEKDRVWLSLSQQF